MCVVITNCSYAGLQWKGADVAKAQKQTNKQTTHNNNKSVPFEEKWSTGEFKVGAKACDERDKEIEE